MKLKREVLETLKCSECDNYLSCGPVLIQDNGNNVCGRCTAPEGSTTIRNMAYENLAQHLCFPCKYDTSGCEMKPKFLRLKSHEDSCNYRQFQCPISEPSECVWFGMVCKFLDHCKLQHSNNVVENPIVLQQKISTPSTHTFVLTAFNILFIVYSKICTQSHKLYNSVQRLNDTCNEAEFDFSLVISHRNNTLIRKSDVCLYKKLEEKPLTLDIQALLMVLDEEGDNCRNGDINSFLSTVSRLMLTSYTITVTVNQKLNCDCKCKFIKKSKSSYNVNARCNLCWPTPSDSLNRYDVV